MITSHTKSSANARTQSVAERMTLTPPDNAVWYMSYAGPAFAGVAHGDTIELTDEGPMRRGDIVLAWGRRKNVGPYRLVRRTTSKDGQTLRATLVDLKSKRQSTFDAVREDGGLSVVTGVVRRLKGH